ncbi:MAG TPA: SURF1 family protein [Gammaproteobacteria bacterium]|nr:SURF1 family protein [Gammaproteobacteria bacterium]
MKYTFRPTLLTTLITLVIFSALLNLGFWQLNRAEFKKLLKMQYFERSQTLINATTLNTKQENLRYFKIQLTGRFDNDHSILLKNKEGYEVLTPFNIFGSTKMILVDRGVVSDTDAKNISPIFGEQTIKGALDIISPDVDTEKLSKQLKHEFYPYVVVSHTPVTLPINVKSEKHIIFAFQWFALSLTLLLLFIMANIRKNNSVLDKDAK